MRMAKKRWLDLDNIRTDGGDAQLFYNPPGSSMARRYTSNTANVNVVDMYKKDHYEEADYLIPEGDPLFEKLRATILLMPNETVHVGSDEEKGCPPYHMVYIPIAEFKGLMAEWIGEGT